MFDPTVETLLVVPSRKVAVMKRLAHTRGLDALVVSPAQSLMGHRPQFVILDESLKMDWDFRMDQWYHENLMLRVGPWTDYVGWAAQDYA